MTEKRFIDLLRQYRDQARKRNRSYNDQVQNLVGMRVASISRVYPEGAERTAAVNKTVAIAQREYGKFDASFLVKPNA